MTILVERSGSGAHGARSNWVAAAAPAVLPANGTVEHEFDVVSCAVRVRLQRRDGTAVAANDVGLTTPGDWPRHPFGPTDAEGRVAGDTEVGTFTVQVGAARTPVGTVNVVPGAANEFTFVVP